MILNIDGVQDARILRLDKSYLGELLSIQETVCKQLARPEMYFPVTSAEMLEFFESDGLCFGVQFGSRLAGFSGLLFMGEREDNVGKDIGLSSDELPHVAYFKICLVLPQHRGMGLQKFLKIPLFEHMGVEMPSGLKFPVELETNADKTSITDRHPFRPLCSTVSPENIASLKSLMECGFWIAGLKPKYNGYLRYLIMRRPQIVTFDETNSVSVSCQDYATQISLLDRGMLGVQLLTEQGEGPKIKYVWPPNSDWSATR